jgi:hypothetical protein
MAVRDPFLDTDRGETGEAAIGLRADFAVNCVRFQLLDENIRRSKSCIGNVFLARDETVSVPENQNVSSHDD